MDAQGLNSIASKASDLICSTDFKKGTDQDESNFDLVGGLFSAISDSSDAAKLEAVFVRAQIDPSKRNQKKLATELANLMNTDEAFAAKTNELLQQLNEALQISDLDSIEARAEALACSLNPLSLPAIAFCPI